MIYKFWCEYFPKVESYAGDTDTHVTWTHHTWLLFIIRDFIFENIQLELGMICTSYITKFTNEEINLYIISKLLFALQPKSNKLKKQKNISYRLLLIAN